MKAIRIFTLSRFVKKRLLILVFMLIAQFSFGQQANKMKYTLEFSTFFVKEDLYGPEFDIYTDSLGNIYLCGCTIDESFPATPNAYQKKLS
jgi:hypothetical protein